MPIYDTARTNTSRKRPLLATLTTCLLAIAAVACQPSTDEVQEDALTTGEELADSATEAATDTTAVDTDVSVQQAGPAAWTCARYLAISDETDASHDIAATEQAEEFFDSFFTAAESREEDPMMRPETPIRATVRAACEDQTDVVLVLGADQLLIESAV